MNAGVDRMRGSQRVDSLLIRQIAGDPGHITGKTPHIVRPKRTSILCDHGVASAQRLFDDLEAHMAHCACDEKRHRGPPLSRSLRPWTSPVATRSLAKAAVSDEFRPRTAALFSDRRLFSQWREAILYCGIRSPTPQVVNLARGVSSRRLRRWDKAARVTD